MRKIFRELITVDEAIDLIMKSFDLKPKMIEEVELLSALDRVLAENIYSEMDVPPFDRAIVDGYAVLAKDTFNASETRPVKLKIIDRIKTGSEPKCLIREGTVAEIDTGAAIPAGADAVVPVEYAEEEDDYVKIYKRVSPGANIQFAGSDISRGEIILRKGYKINPRDIGVLAALGFSHVKVFTKPKVAIFSIGDELVSPGEKLDRVGLIYDVNSYTLYSNVIKAGGIPIYLGVARDDERDIRSKVIEGVEKADIIVSSGSSSAGYSDMIYRVIESIGESKLLAHGIKSKPGKPVLIASIKSKPYFGLPGFPTSCLIAFRNFVKPVIMLLAGYDPKEALSEVEVTLKRRVRGEKGRRLFKTISLKKLREGINGIPLPAISGAITTLANAEGYFEVHENVEYYSSGEKVRVKLFEPILKLPNIIVGGVFSPKIDELISLFASTRRNYRVKYLKMNNLGAIKSLLAGEIDLAIINPVNPITGELDEAIIRGEKLVKLASIPREIGLVYGSKKNIGGIKDAIESRLTLANREKGSGIREYIDYLLMSYARMRGIDIDALKTDIPGYHSEYRTDASAIIAVINGKADYTLAPREIAELYNVSYERIGFISLLLVASESTIGISEIQDLVDTIKRNINKI